MDRYVVELLGCWGPRSKSESLTGAALRANQGQDGRPLTSSLACLVVMKGLGSKMRKRRRMMSKWKRVKKRARMRREMMILRSQLERREMNMKANLLTRMTRKKRRRKGMKRKSKSNHWFHF